MQKHNWESSFGSWILNVCGAASAPFILAPGEKPVFSLVLD